MVATPKSKKKEKKLARRKADKAAKAEKEKAALVAEKVAAKAKAQHEKDQSRAQAAATKQVQKDQAGSLALATKVVAKLQPLMTDLNLLVMPCGTMAPQVEKLPESIKAMTTTALSRGAHMMTACIARATNALAPINFTASEATKVCDEVKLVTSMLHPFRNVLTGVQ